LAISATQAPFVKHFKNSWAGNVLQILSVVQWWQRLIIVVGLFISGLFELIGLTTIVPLLASSTGGLATKSYINEIARSILQQIGLPPTEMSLLIVLVAGLSLKSVLTIAVMTYVSNVISAVTHEIRLALVRNLLHANWSYFVRQPLGRLTHAAGPEASAIGEAFLGLANLFSTVLQALMYLLIATLVSWKLAIVTVLIGVFMFLSFGHLVRRTRRAAHEHNARLRLMAGSLTDAMIGIKPIKAMGRHGIVAALFEADARQLSATLRTRAISSEFASELQEPLIGLCLVGGFYAATRSVTFAIHEMIFMPLLLVRIILALSQTQRLYQRYIIAQDQSRSILQLLEETAAAREIPTGARLPTLESEIALDRVSFAYGEKPVLHEVSFSIPRGSITAIIGPSGAGKSTIADLILRFYRPLSGRIMVDGVDLEDADLVRWRSSLGYVPQELNLFHDTVLRNITLGETRYTEEEVREALAAAGALSFVEELPGGLNYVVGERGSLLSGGQRQRIAIARALVHRPALLILDEATTGLDPATEESICRNVEALSRASGLTVLAISHQPNWQQLADRIIILRDGVAIETTPEFAARARSHG
jgi:ATP-binding cassette subfamily C protein